MPSFAQKLLIMPARISFSTIRLDDCMRKLKVGIIDILGKSATKKTWFRFIRANNMSIMPQVVAV